MDNQVNCLKCGTNNELVDGFCSECGTELNAYGGVIEDTEYNTKLMYFFKRNTIMTGKSTITLLNNRKIQYHAQEDTNNKKVLIIASSLTFSTFVFMGIGILVHLSENLTLFISMVCFIALFIIVLALGSFDIVIKSNNANLVGKVLCKNIIKKKNSFFINSDNLRTSSLKFFPKKQAILLVKNQTFKINIAKGEKVPFQVVNDSNKVVLEAKSDLSTNYPLKLSINRDESFDELLMVFTIITIVRKFLTKTPN